jgi:hypothetical protein
MKTKTFTLKELEADTLNYMRKHRNTGGASEFDTTINNISRAKIKAFNKLAGECWLLKINRYSEEEKAQPVLIKYKGQKIFNFGYSAAIPCYDQVIIDMLLDYEKPTDKPFNGKDTMSKINAITKRIDELKGIFLFWS